LGGAPVLIDRSYFTGNVATRNNGGGVDNGAASLRVLNSTFDGNRNASVVGYGGGLSSYLNTTAHIVGSTFTGNSTAGRGGGLSAAESLYVTATTFIGNSAERGGGLVVTANGRGSVVNSLFANNSIASSNGAAIRVESAQHLDVMYNTIVGTGSGRIAVYVAGGSGSITDTIISGYGYGIGVLGGASASEDYNLFYQVPITYDGAVAAGTHHPHGDPRFADPANDNYHLLLGSAAYNAGVDVGITSDFFGAGRPSFGGYDIGYHEVNDTPINNLTAANTSPTRLGGLTVLTATSTGPNVIYTWDLRDGSLARGPSVTHVYTAPGVYTAVVTATNGIDEATATTPVTITIAVYLPVVIR
jgi:hypothetical protein